MGGVDIDKSLTGCTKASNKICMRGSLMDEFGLVALLHNKLLSVNVARFVCSVNCDSQIEYLIWSVHSTRAS